MEALEILEDLRHVLFQDFTKWRGYSRRDFSKAIAELEALEQHIEELKSENAKLKDDQSKVVEFLQDMRSDTPGEWKELDNMIVLLGAIPNPPLTFPRRGK